MFLWSMTKVTVWSVCLRIKKIFIFIKLSVGS